MVDKIPEKIDDKWILSHRGKKNVVDPFIPYAYLVEKEFSHIGLIEDVATIFLTNRECPFHCLMCDLWKNTTDEKVPVGAIPQQIKYALNKLPSTNHLKLYNSGNFFDLKAIPVEDYRAIAELVSDFQSLIVECHPKLINQKCLDFNQLIQTELQVAMGLETVHPHILPKLNKQMDLKDFERTVRFLFKNNIKTRAFILLGLPGLNESESVEWAKRSVKFAFEAGVECCAVIPTRSGNGVMDIFQRKDEFGEPYVESLQEVLEYGISLNAGRVFADLWDLEHFSRGEANFDKIKKRMEFLNLHQLLE